MGSSRTFVIRGDGEGLVGVLFLPLTALVQQALLFPLPVPLGLLREALGLAILRGCFPLAFALFAIENSTDHLLAGRRVPPQLAYEIPACYAQMKGTNNFGVGDAGELDALLGKRRM